MLGRTFPRPFRPPAALVVGALLWAVLPVAGAGEAEMSAPGAAVATGSGQLETEIIAETLQAAVDPAGGTPRFVPAQRLAAGDEVHYTIRVHNPGKAPVTDVQVTKRVPDGLQFVPGSATGPACDVEYSLDGGRSYRARADGEAPSHLRWTLRRPLAPGATALLRFRATFR